MRIRFLFPALLIGLVACSSSPDEAAPTSTDAPPADAITISVADFMIDPSEVEASGPTVSFEVTNDGVAGRRHASALGLQLAALEAMQAGGIVEFGEREAGTWRVRMAVPV